MLSNSSVPDSSSKSPSSRTPESPANARFPFWLLPVVWGILGVIAQIHLCLPAVSIDILPAIAALISTVCLMLGGITLFRFRAPLESQGTHLPKTKNIKASYILLLFGVLVGFFGGIPFGGWTLAAALLIVLHNSIPRRLAVLQHLLLSLLVASLFFGTALAMGSFLHAAYPAVFAFFFFCAWQTTRAVETSRVDVKNKRITLATWFGPRATLAIGGILFFLFGIITTWPYLNGLYSAVYFWIIILGVDFPMLWMWGKLRGRDKELSSPAIARFNRAVRWLIFIVLIALLFA